jgi:hypothetical protein
LTASFDGINVNTNQGMETIFCHRLAVSLPIKSSQVATRPSTKILLEDWPWQGNRDLSVQASIWHKNRGKRSEAMLLGDGHSEFYKFPDGLSANQLTAPDKDYLFGWLVSKVLWKRNFLKHCHQCGFKLLFMNHPIFAKFYDAVPIAH